VSEDWSQIYRVVYPDLFRYLHARVWDEDRAHDLAQEAFVRALDHRPENPRAWLFSVATNLARDEARTSIRRRKHLALLKNESEARPEHEPEATRRLEREEVRRSVQRALAELTDRDREVLLLWNAGASYGEIAEHSGLSQGAIGTTLARARRRLVEAYQELEKPNVARN